MSGDETEVTVSEHTEDVEDPDALKRALLAERYEEERLDTSVEKDKSSTQADEPSKSRQAVQEVISPTVTTEQIMEVSVRPEISDSIDEAIETEEIEAVQFTFSNGLETPWYDWAPTNEDAALTRIIEYYGNGDFANLHGKTVDITTMDRETHIVYPAPHDKHTAYLGYPLWRRLNALDSIQHKNKITNASFENSGFMSPDHQNLSLTYLSDETGVETVTTSAMMLGMTGLVSVLALALSSSGAAVILAAGLFVHLALGPVLSDSPSQWYYPVLFPLKAGTSLVKRGLARLNSK